MENKSFLKHTGCDVFPTFSNISNQRNRWDITKLSTLSLDIARLLSGSVFQSCVRAENGNFSTNLRTIALFISILTVFPQKTKPSHFQQICFAKTQTFSKVLPDLLKAYKTLWFSMCENTKQKWSFGTLTWTVNNFFKWPFPVHGNICKYWNKINFKPSRLDFTKLYIQRIVFEFLEAQPDQPLRGSPHAVQLNLTPVT